MIILVIIIRVSICLIAIITIGILRHSGVYLVDREAVGLKAYLGAVISKNSAFHLFGGSGAVLLYAVHQGQFLRLLQFCGNFARQLNGHIHGAIRLHLLVLSLKGQVQRGDALTILPCCFGLCAPVQQRSHFRLCGFVQRHYRQFCVLRQNTGGCFGRCAEARSIIRRRIFYHLRLFGTGGFRRGSFGKSCACKACRHAQCRKACKQTFFHG